MKKTVQAIVIALFMVLTSMVSCQIFQVHPVSAHDENYVHPYMCDEAWKLLTTNSNLSNEISYYLDRIKDGSYDEDHNDHVYGLWYALSQAHYWEADKGPDKLTKNQLGMDDEYPNAWMKIQELYAQALYYISWKPFTAYERLGHCAHLIEDMSVPAHVHMDLHDAGNLITGDDSYEEWMADAYVGYSPADRTLVTFPETVKEDMHNGIWQSGLFYLMYTTNQRADYFASDDYDGNTDDYMGWMDYSGWQDSPTKGSQMADNDYKWDLHHPFPLDDDNNRDGDLNRIASNTFPYAIRAVATLYKMFYEQTHPPQSVSINIVDFDRDGIADFPMVKCDLTYDNGAPEVLGDLQICFSNDYVTWSSWESVPGPLVTLPYRVTRNLLEGDGNKTIYLRVRNLMGQITEASDNIILVQTAIPQLFDYQFSATGYSQVGTHVEYHVDRVQVFDDAQYYFYGFLTESPEGNGSGRVYKPDKDHYYEIDADHDYGYGQGIINTNTYMGYEPYTYDLLHAWDCYPGEELTCNIRAWDYNNGDDFGLGHCNIIVNAYSHVTPGVIEPHIGPFWIDLFDNDGNLDSKMRYWLYEEQWGTPWSYGWPTPKETFVEYGTTPGVNDLNYVAASNLSAPVDYTTVHQVSIPNPAIEYTMEGPKLYAWTTKTAPDMAIGVLSPVDFQITDPTDSSKMVRSEKHSNFLMGHWHTWWELTSTIPGTSIVRELDLNRDGVSEPIDLDGDGSQDTLIVFNTREAGNYQVQVSPSVQSDPADTYSIAVVSSALPHNAGFLSQDVRLEDIPTQPLIMKSGTTLNLPPTADAGGPYWTTEGTTVSFNAGHSTDPNGDTLQYRWDFENDGTWDTAFSNSPIASPTWNDDWTGTAKVEVSNGELTATATAAVTISNAAAVVNAGADQTAAPNEEVYFSGSYTDLGAADTHTVEWDFGDGTTITDTLTPTHIFTESKIYTVNLTVTDDNGGTGIDTLTVNTGIEISIDPTIAIIPPGKDRTYNILVHNSGSPGDTFNVSVSGLDPTWYTLSTSVIHCPQDQSQLVTLTISPPITATKDDYGFVIVATCQIDPTVRNFVSAHALVTTASDLGLEETPPVTNLAIGQPQYINPLSGNIYVTSATLLTLTAEDNPGGSGLESTFYHICNNTYDTGRLEYTTPFSLSGLSDGQYTVVYYSRDNYANEEQAKSTSLTLDNTPPSTIKTVGIPKYGSNALWVTSSTPFNLTASDTIYGSGVNAIKYRIGYNSGWTSWGIYTNNFMLSGEGKHYLEYYSIDHLGNTETIYNQTHYVDDSPPVVTISASPNSLWPPNNKMKNILISGSATDAGSGIASVTFNVEDEYNLVEPTLTGFGQTIQLQAMRYGYDMNGRTYTITATATDNLGHVTTATTVVRVPHDQGN